MKKESNTYAGDPVYYHPEYDLLISWENLHLLMPEISGWILIGNL